MNCFNRLLKSPPSLEPNPPSEDLKEHFRAVCMAIDMDISDPGGREEARKEEFYKHIYPVWKEALPEAEFQRYQDILDGTTRKRATQEKEERRRLEAEEAEKRREEAAAKAAQEDEGMGLAALSQAALEAEEAMDAGPRRRLRRRAPRPPATGGPGVLEEGVPAPVLDSIDELIDAVAEGELRVEYSRRSARRPFAHYRFRDENVSVQLVRTSNSYYLLVSYPLGFSELPGAAEVVNAVMTSMEYEQTGPFAYEKKQGELAFRVSLGAHSTNLAEKRLFPFTPTTLGRAIEQMNDDMVTIIARIEGDLRRRA